MEEGRIEDEEPVIGGPQLRMLSESGLYMWPPSKSSPAGILSAVRPEEKPRAGKKEGPRASFIGNFPDVEKGWCVGEQPEVGGGKTGSGWDMIAFAQDILSA